MNVTAVRLTDEELVQKLRDEVNFDCRGDINGLKPENMMSPKQIQEGKAPELEGIMAHDVLVLVNTPKHIKPTRTRWVLSKKTVGVKVVSWSKMSPSNPTLNSIHQHLTFLVFVLC